MRFSEIRDALTAKFPPEAHKERQLPGGGTWWFVPWQLIRDRLNEICPDDWSVRYDEPKFLDKFCHIACHLTICGITRSAIGSAKIEELSNAGKDMARGNPIERAIADAFKNCAESFGICAYLDEQTDRKADFARYMHRYGHGKPVAEYHKQHPQPAPKPQSTVAPVAINANADRFNQIKRWTGHNNSQIVSICSSLGLPTSSAQLNAAQVLQVRDRLFVDWGMTQNKFNHLKHAEASFKNLLASFDNPDPDDSIVWEAWAAKVAEKPSIDHPQAG